jgi:hypothetical protein
VIRRAARAQDPRLARAAALTAVVGRTPQECAELATRALAVTRRGELALVAAVGDLARAGEDPVGAQGRLLVLLLDLEQRPPAQTAALLGIEPDAVPGLLAAARTRDGGHPGQECRGWGLACRPPGQTASERDAGVAHLALCRRCRDRVAAVERQRAVLRQRAAGVAALAGASQLAAASTPLSLGAGGLLAGKVTAGLVGALGAAVVATGAAAVVSQQGGAPAVPRPAPTGVESPLAPRAPAAPTRAACALPCKGLASTAPPAAARGVVPPVPRAPAPAGRPAVPLLPTALPTAIPIPLPIPLPTGLLAPLLGPLPTALPTLLPTALPTLGSLTLP